MNAIELATILVTLERDDPANQRLHWQLTKEEEILDRSKFCNDYYHIKTYTQLQFAAEKNHPIYMDLTLEHSLNQSVELYVVFNQPRFLEEMKKFYPKYTPRMIATPNSLWPKKDYMLSVYDTLIEEEKQKAHSAQVQQMMRDGV